MNHTMTVPLGAQHCAFCKYWYDPLNTAIEPKGFQGRYWYIDKGMQKICLAKHLKRFAWDRCDAFLMKLEYCK